MKQLLIICTFYLMVISPLIAQSLKTIYEAESSQLSEVTVKSDASASQGQYVEMGKTGSLGWEVDIPRDGRYQIVLRYRATSSDKAQKLVINGNTWPMGFSITYQNWEEAKWMTYLHQGKNTIEMKPDWGYMDIDYLRVGTMGRSNPTPVYELPTLSPRENIYYTKSPREISLCLYKNGHQLVSISEGNKKLGYKEELYPYVEDAVLIIFPSKELAALSPGIHNLKLNFNDGSQSYYELKVMKKRKPAELTIIVFDVNHGNSTLFIFPNGKTLLVDSAYPEYAKKVVIPFLERHGITHLDHYFITHNHDDHMGMKDEIIKKFTVTDFRDNTQFKSGDELDMENTRVKILNADGDGAKDDLNSNSLSFRMKYKGFVYVHGGDIYGDNQVKILDKFPEDVRADVYYANHHFHGSVDVTYLRKTDPYLFINSVQEAVYARGAYMQRVREDSEDYLKNHDGRLMDDLLTVEAGSVVLRINNQDDWSYETYKNSEQFRIPYLRK